MKRASNDGNDIAKKARSDIQEREEEQLPSTSTAVHYDRRLVPYSDTSSDRSSGSGSSSSASSSNEEYSDEEMYVDNETASDSGSSSEDDDIVYEDSDEKEMDDEEEVEEEEEEVEGPLHIDGVLHEVKDFYKVEDLSRSRNKRFRVEQEDISIRFRKIAKRTKDLDGLFDLVMLDVLEKSKPAQHGSDLRVSVAINQEGQPRAYYMKPSVYSDTIPNILRKEISFANTSTGVATPLLLSELHVRISWIDVPTGSGNRSFAKKNDWSNITKAKGNKDCLAKAIAIGMAYLDRKNDSPRWRSIRYEGRQQEVADLYHREFGIPKKNTYSIDDVKLFQENMPGVQLVLFYGDKPGRAVFSGEYIDDTRVIGLRLRRGHFDHIKRISTFFNRQFYCPRCDVLVDSSNAHYSCPVNCDKCGTRQKDLCNGHGAHKCEACGVVCHNEECLTRHQEKGTRGGRSFCEILERCPNCHRSKGEKRKGRPHQCGYSYCATCCEDRPEGHKTCYVSPLPPLSKKFQKKTIVFDIETRIVKNKRGAKMHVPNLIIALRSCGKCEGKLPEDVYDVSCSCENCGGRRLWQWQALDDPKKKIIEEFCDWVFGDEHKGFTVVAHNLRAYDGQFILRHLCSDRSPVSPSELIMAGRKIMKLEVNNVRMVDSLSFLAMPLASFPKAFGIKELKKGYFPHRFNRPANYQYVGKIPDKKYFGYKSMRDEARTAFDDWHDKHEQNEFTFDFRLEIEAYCFSDVVLLHEGIRIFDAECFGATGVHVFHESVTAASAAMRVFRRKFLKKDLLAVEKPITAEDKQSRLALKMLAYLRKTKGVHIRDAQHGGEKRIKGTRYRVDGFVKRPSKRDLIIEVHIYCLFICICFIVPLLQHIFWIHGCYWHACRCRYSDHTMVRGRCAALIRQEDEARLQHLRRKHKVIVIRECQIEKRLKKDDKMRQFFADYEIGEPLNLYDAFFGGRCEVFRMYAKPEPGYKIRYLDVCSLYPYTNKYRPYPVGKGKMLDVSRIQTPITKPEELTIQGFVKCTVLPPTRLFVPVLALRSGGKNVMPLCAACAEKMDPYTLGCQHSKKERQFVGTFATVELIEALKCGYKILKIHSARHYKKWSLYERNATTGQVSHGVLSEYMDTWVGKKTEASGWPASADTEEKKNAFITRFEEREGIRLNTDTIAHNPAARQVSKLMANSLWGKLGERNDRLKTEIVDDPSRFFRLMNDADVDVRDYCLLGDRKLQVTFRPSTSATLKPLPTTSLASAVLTTAYARCTLLNIIQRIPHPEERLLYVDTDSVLYLHKEDEVDPLAELEGDFLGDLTDELGGGRGVEFVAQGPKAYAYRWQTPDGKRHEKAKCRGFPVTRDSAASIHFRSMHRFVRRLKNRTGWKKIPIPYERFAIDGDHGIETVTFEKLFQPVFNKRRIPFGTYGTFPYGYRGT